MWLFITCTVYMYFFMVTTARRFVYSILYSACIAVLFPFFNRLASAGVITHHRQFRCPVISSEERTICVRSTGVSFPGAWVIVDVPSLFTGRTQKPKAETIGGGREATPPSLLRRQNERNLDTMFLVLRHRRASPGKYALECSVVRNVIHL